MLEGRRLLAWWQAALPFSNKCRGCLAWWALCQAWPVGLCVGPQVMWQQWAVQDKVWTRASTGPLPPPGFSSSLDLANAGAFQGIRYTFLGPWTCMYRGPVSFCGGPDLATNTGMYSLFLPRGALGPAHWAPFSMWS
jgi:hypothetical protein